MSVEKMVSNAIRGAIESFEGCRDPYHALIADKAAHAVLALLPQRCTPTEDEVAEALRQPHGPISGKPLWQRNHKTGMLESTCECGEVLSIKEEYTYIETIWARTRSINGAGKAWYTHRNERTVATIAALYAAQPTVREAKAAAWDEGAEFMDSDAFHFDGGREMNPYRDIRLTAGGEVPYDEVPSDELPGMWERSDFV